MSEYIERIPACNSALWRGERSLLPQLDMELTERCNNNCIHCWINLPADDAAARDRELSTEEVKRILREAVALGCLQVNFTGGEPLLREDFEDLYLFARSQGLKVRLCTNGRLVTPRLVDLFARIPPQIEIEISVYGTKVDSYEGVSRVEGSYAEFREGVNLLLSRGVPFIIVSALLPPIRCEMDEIDAWAAKIPWMKGPPLYSMLFALRKRRDDADKCRQIERLRVSPEDALVVLNRRPARERSSWMEFCRKHTKPAGDGLFQCRATMAGCVDAYGRYQVCISLCAPEWTYDLHRHSLKEVLEILAFRTRDACATNPEYMNRCARCFIRPLCEQCPAKSWIESGTLDTPVECLCAAAHAQARALELIQTNENAWNVLDREERINKVFIYGSKLHG